MHEFKHFVAEVLFGLGNIFSALNMKNNMRPYPWLVSNVKNIVATRKNANV